MTPDQRARLSDHSRHFRRISSLHLLVGSPAGWLLLVPLALYALQGAARDALVRNTLATSDVVPTVQRDFTLPFENRYVSEERRLQYERRTKRRDSMAAYAG